MKASAGDTDSERMDADKQIEIIILDVILIGTTPINTVGSVFLSPRFLFSIKNGRHGYCVCRSIRFSKSFIISKLIAATLVATFFVSIHAAIRNTAVGILHKLL